MRIRNHRSSKNSTCISNGTFHAPTMACSNAHAFPLAKTTAVIPSTIYPPCPPSSSQAASIFDVTQNPLDNINAHVRCLNHVVALSDLGEVLLPPIPPATKPLFSNHNTPKPMGIEKFRICTVNMSPWDVPSFFHAFERDSAPSSHDHNSNQKRKTRITLVHKQKHSDAKQCWKPNKPANTTDELNKPKTLRLETIEAQINFKRRDKFAKLDAEEVMIESALKNVLSECGGGGLGLTVREAACRVLLFHKYNIDCKQLCDNNNNNDNRNACGGLPLSVVVRRVMLNSPYFVELNRGRFALWDDFIQRRTFPDDINSQNLIVDSEETSCNEHEKNEVDVGVFSSSSYLEKTKRKRSSRKMGLTREENKNMEPIPEKTNMRMKHSATPECGSVDQTEDRNSKSDEEIGTSEKNEEEEEEKEGLWLNLMGRNREQSSPRKNKKRKAVKARSLKALVDTF